MKARVVHKDGCEAGWAGMETVVGRVCGCADREIVALTATTARLVAALDACEATRGRFSCTYPHDNRCPKARVDRPEDWRGVWQCECGAEELDAAVTVARAALARPGVVRVREEGEG